MDQEEFRNKKICNLNGVVKVAPKDFKQIISHTHSSGVNVRCVLGVEKVSCLLWSAVKQV